MFIPEVNFSFYQYGMLLSLTWREALSQTVSVFIYVEARSHKSLKVRNLNRIDKNESYSRILFCLLLFFSSIF